MMQMFEATVFLGGGMIWKQTLSRCYTRQEKTKWEMSQVCWAPFKKFPFQSLEWIETFWQCHLTLYLRDMWRRTRHEIALQKNSFFWFNKWYGGRERSIQSWSELGRAKKIFNAFQVNPALRYWFWGMMRKENLGALGHERKWLCYFQETSILSADLLTDHPARMG